METLAESLNNIFWRGLLSRPFFRYHHLAPFRETTMFELPQHIEKRRETVLNALDILSIDVIRQHQAVADAIAAYNAAVDGFNRCLDHATGWTIEAAAVIDIHLVGSRSDEWWKTPQGRAVAAWRDEICNGHFPRVDRARLYDLPMMDHATTLAELPRFPNDPRHYGVEIVPPVADA
jgi:hypothetical protein